MAIGIRRKGIETEKWRIDIPKDLAYRFEKLPSVYNPATGEKIFGARSQILTKLIGDYILNEETKLALKRKAA